MHKIHAEIIRTDIPDETRQQAIDNFLKDKRFERFQSFAEQALRILDNETGKYLYASESTGKIIGWTTEELKAGGLSFANKQTHPWDPWDLLQLLLISSRVYKKLGKLNDEENWIQGFLLI